MTIVKGLLLVSAGLFALSSFAFGDEVDIKERAKQQFRQEYLTALRAYQFEMSFAHKGVLNADDITALVGEDGMAVAGTDVATLTLVNDEKIVINYSNTKEEQDEFNKFVGEWVEQNIASDMTEKEKALKIYDFMLKTYRYKSGDYGLDSPYLSSSTLVKGREGVCGAFSGMVRELGRKAGLEVIDVFGRIKDEDNTLHAWSAVKIDGQWYFIDVTFGMTAGDRYKYFLCGSDTIEKIHTYQKEKYPEISAKDLIQVRYEKSLTKDK